MDIKRYQTRLKILNIWGGETKKIWQTQKRGRGCYSHFKFSNFYTDRVKLSFGTDKLISSKFLILGQSEFWLGYISSFVNSFSRFSFFSEYLKTLVTKKKKIGKKIFLNYASPIFRLILSKTGKQDVLLCRSFRNTTKLPGKLRNPLPVFFFFFTLYCYKFANNYNKKVTKF